MSIFREPRSDNRWRRAQFLEISDRRRGVFSFIAQGFFDQVTVRVEARLRGVMAIDSDNEEDFYTAVSELLDDNELSLYFWPKKGNHVLPWLVDVWIEKGDTQLCINEWAVENGYARYYRGNGNDTEEE